MPHGYVEGTLTDTPTRSAYLNSLINKNDMSNTKEQLALIKAVLTGTDRGAGQAPLYPMDSEIVAKSIDGVDIALVKHPSFGNIVAKVIDDDKAVGDTDLLLSIKGTYDEASLPSSGKLVVLSAFERRTGKTSSGNDWEVKKGETKAFIAI